MGPRMSTAMTATARRRQLMNAEEIERAVARMAHQMVEPEEAQAGLAALRSHPLGADAAEVGEIVAEPAESVVLRTGFGGTRIVDMLVGDPLPRIC